MKIALDIYVYVITKLYDVLGCFNESLARGDVPDEWRQANVSPVFKKGEKYDAANYRTASLTCICSKTLEHILVSYINKHLALDSILADCQHARYKIQETLFNVGFHKQITLATRAIFRQIRE